MKRSNCETSDTPNANDIKILEDGLSGAVPLNIVSRNYRPLVIFQRNEGSDIIAGLDGSTYWQWLNIRLLWVSEELRGQGIGSDLVRKAEEIAKGRGCHASVVDTFSFQAPEFYKQLGYKIFAELEDFPKGQKRFYLSKVL